MSTRAIVYFHHEGEKEEKLNYTAKLYHHRDGYLEGLGMDLNKIFKDFKKFYEKNNSGSQRELFKGLWDEWGFELTPYYHSDTEFVYHVYYNDERNIMEPNSKKFNFKIYFQRDWDHEGIWDEPMTLFSDNWKLNEHFIPNE